MFFLRQPISNPAVDVANSSTKSPLGYDILAKLTRSQEVQHYIVQQLKMLQ